MQNLEINLRYNTIQELQPFLTFTKTYQIASQHNQIQNKIKLQLQLPYEIKDKLETQLKQLKSINSIKDYFLEEVKQYGREFDINNIEDQQQMGLINQPQHSQSILLEQEQIQTNQTNFQLQQKQNHIILIIEQQNHPILEKDQINSINEIYLQKDQPEKNNSQTLQIISSTYSTLDYEYESQVINFEIKLQNISQKRQQVTIVNQIEKFQQDIKQDQKNDKKLMNKSELNELKQKNKYDWTALYILLALMIGLLIKIL